jgi:hypothetical protein
MPKMRFIIQTRMPKNQSIAWLERLLMSSVAIVLTVNLLTACGGSSDSSNPIAPAQIPMISLASVVPAVGSVNVETTSATTFVFNYRNANSFSISPADSKTLCNGISIPTTALVTKNDTTKHEVTVTVTSKDMPGAAGCTVSLAQITAIGDTASANYVDAHTNFKTNCASSQTYYPGLKACVYPTGVRVVGATKLPDDCLAINSQCWKEAVANGTVKWVKTNAVWTVRRSLDGTPTVTDSTRPIVFAYFHTSHSKSFSVADGTYPSLMPFYADDGTPADPYAIKNPNLGASGDLPFTVDWIFGTDKGLITHDTNGPDTFGYCRRYELVIPNGILSFGESWTFVNTPLRLACPGG